MLLSVRLKPKCIKHPILILILSMLVITGCSKDNPEEPQQEDKQVEDKDETGQEDSTEVVAEADEITIKGRI